MAAQISALMTTPVITVAADDSLSTVAAIMARHGLTFIPVAERADGPALGIITASDILHFQSGGGDPDNLRAWQICAYKPLTVTPEATVADVARLMVERQAHHVLVMRGHELVGVVSSLDYVRHFLTQPEAAPAQAGAQQGAHHA